MALTTTTETTMPKKQPGKQPLVTAKPPKPWKDMTDDDIDALADNLFAKMKEGMDRQK